jgi:enterochelin esterase family protein
MIVMVAPRICAQDAGTRTPATGQTDTKAATAGPADAKAYASAPTKKSTAVELIEMAKARSAELAGAIRASFEEKDLRAGTAWSSRGADFFFAVYSDARPTVRVDAAFSYSMTQIPHTDLWYATAKIVPVGQVHAFDYVILGEEPLPCPPEGPHEKHSCDPGVLPPTRPDKEPNQLSVAARGGKPFGGTQNLPVYTELSYLQPGVPSGVLSEKITQTSKIYDGMKSEYQIYVPAEYDAKTPAALMVFQDGIWYTDRDAEIRALNVIDNLIAQRKIPVMICVFIKPGSVTDAPGTPTYNFVKAYSERWGRGLDDSMRSTLYDTVSDRYPRFLRDEILADVGAKYNLRKDAYSRAITGLSSGGICAFNAAWQMPEQFSRVIAWIGSFTSIQWKEDAANPDGGQDYPDKVLREPRRNIRIWLQDGANDMENPKYGSWPLANVRLANALKLKEYDFHFSFGKGSHSAAHGAAEFPAEMIWLWRDYDPSKTDQTYVIDAAEKAKPAFRVGILNRDGE